MLVAWGFTTFDGAVRDPRGPWRTSAELTLRSRRFDPLNRRNIRVTNQRLRACGAAQPVARDRHTRPAGKGRAFSGVPIDSRRLFAPGPLDIVAARAIRGCTQVRRQCLFD